MSGPGKEYVIGKGRLFFDMFASGSKTPTGERYLGNSPELSSSQSVDTLDHIDADQGLNVKDEQITISNDLTLQFAVDNIINENLALWYGGDIEKSTIVAATDIADPDFVGVKQGTWLQLGVSEDTPSGTRKVTNVVVSTVVAGAPETVTPVTAAGNFEVDLEKGRVYIEPGSVAIVDGATLRIEYDQEAMTRTIVIGKGKEIRGALRFIADNPVGENKDYFWPYVKLTSNGDYALKGDTWQQMSFTAEVLKKDAATERLYIDGAAA